MVEAAFFVGMFAGMFLGMAIAVSTVKWWRVPDA